MTNRGFDMDVETAETVQRLLRLIDNVNDRSMLNGLSLDLSIVLACAMRRQGLLSALEIDTIEKVFTNAEVDWPSGRAEKARKVLDASRKLWDITGEG
jgi:hypothetical protein